MKKYAPVTDKTYTVNSVSSSYNATKMMLKIYLPQEIAQNPYEYTVYDVSQIISGKHQNAVFIYMKRLTDDGTDLSGMDNDKYECSLTFEHSTVIPVTGMDNYSAFDPDKDNTLVTIYHDISTDSTYKQNCAGKIYPKVNTIRTNVINDGNYQTSLSLMGGQPKKSGMSMIPKL